MLRKRYSSLSPHLFFRDLLSIDNVGIIVICGTDLIMGQYTNIRYLAQLSAMEEYSLVREKACEFADGSGRKSGLKWVDGQTTVFLQS